MDDVVPEGGTALLDGSLTFSMIGPIISYAWTQVSGPPVTLFNPTGEVAVFQAPIVDEDTLLVFRLEASDGVFTGADEDVRIIVINLRTTAVAGVDRSVEEGSYVWLDGTGSVTTTGNIFYRWTQTAGTDVGVTGATSASVWFTAPLIYDYEEELTFRLEVNDGAGGTSRDEVVITVRNYAAWPPRPLGPGYFKEILHLGETLDDGIVCSHYPATGVFLAQNNAEPYPRLEWDFTTTDIWVTRNPLVWTPFKSDDGMFISSGSAFEHFYHIYILCPEFRLARLHLRYSDEIDVRKDGYWTIHHRGSDGGMDRIQDCALYEGANPLAFAVRAEGGGHFAAGITDRSDQPFPDLQYSLGPTLDLPDAYVVRRLPPSYSPGEPINVELWLKVNPESIPDSVIVREEARPGMGMTDWDITDWNVNAPGATVSGLSLAWNLTGPDVKHRVITYSLTVAGEANKGLRFMGSLKTGETFVNTLGDRVIYPFPKIPRSLALEMLQAAHLRWTAPVTEGTESYNIYRSVNGDPFEFIGTTRRTSYTDKWVVPGDLYAYKVSAVNVSSVEGPLSRPTPQVSVPAMAVREAENFNYGGGQYPGYQDCPAAIEGVDFYHPNTGGTNAYRPANATPDGLAIETAEEADDPGVFQTGITSIDAGSWYQYTFNVPQAGWIKLEFRVASPSGGTLSVQWDGTLVGKLTCSTGDWHVFTWALMEDEIQTSTGAHTLTVHLEAGQLNFDKVAVQWNAAYPARRTIWEDNFDSYTTTAAVFSPTVGKWTRGYTTNSAGSWTLWDTEGPPLVCEPANIAGMENKYMISDSDFSGAGVLLDEEMLSPEVDCTRCTGLRLTFDRNYRIYEDPEHLQIAEVDIRASDPAMGWSNWVNLLHLDTSLVPAGLNPPELSGPEQFDLSAYDRKRIQLRFHFYDNEYDYWFAVDNIRVSGYVQEEIPGPGPWPPGPGYISVSWTHFGNREYWVEYTTDLMGTWTTIAGPFTQTTFTTPIPSDRQGFYRVVSYP
ncbi:MAG: carbohydrate-binding protein [bacterium]|nr:carbohydrate-binding protein [bacterium]